VFGLYALVVIMDDEILEKMPEWLRILRKAIEEYKEVKE
jgi:hypothetical protein